MVMEFALDHEMTPPSDAALYESICCAFLSFSPLRSFFPSLPPHSHANSIQLHFLLSLTQKHVDLHLQQAIRYERAHLNKQRVKVPEQPFPLSSSISFTVHSRSLSFFLSLSPLVCQYIPGCFCCPLYSERPIYPPMHCQLHCPSMLFFC